MRDIGVVMLSQRATAVTPLSSVHQRLGAGAAIFTNTVSQSVSSPPGWGSVIMMSSDPDPEARVKWVEIHIKLLI